MNGRDYLTLSSAEKSRVLYWIIKRIIKRSCLPSIRLLAIGTILYFFRFSAVGAVVAINWSAIDFRGEILLTAQNVFNVRWKFKYFFRPRFPPLTACFRKLPRQLTPSNYFITSKFSRSVYFFKLLVISNVGMICN